MNVVVMRQSHGCSDYGDGSGSYGGSCDGCGDYGDGSINCGGSCGNGRGRDGGHDNVWKIAVVEEKTVAGHWWWCW